MVALNEECNTRCENKPRDRASRRCRDLSKKQKDYESRASLSKQAEYAKKRSSKAEAEGHDAANDDSEADSDAGISVAEIASWRATRVASARVREAAESDELECEVLRLEAEAAMAAIQGNFGYPHQNPSDCADDNSSDCADEDLEEWILV